MNQHFRGATSWIQLLQLGLAAMELNDLEDSCELIAYETSCMRHHLTWNSFLMCQKSKLQFSSTILKYLPVDKHTLK